MQGSERVRVVLVDDHAMVAESIRRALTLEHGLDVVAVAADLASAIELVTSLAPDVVVVDHRLPDAIGAAAVRALRRAAPDLRVVACPAHGSPEIAAAAFAAGASGYVEKRRPLHELAEAIRAAHAGAVASPQAAVAPDAGPATGRRLLSPREHEVLALVGEGISTREIAARLDISLHTVRKHVQTILGKLDAHSKLEGVARARRLGLLDDVRRD